MSEFSFLTGAECIPIGGSGLTHLVVSDNVEPDNIPVISSRVMVVKQQVCLLTILTRVHMIPAYRAGIMHSCYVCRYPCMRVGELL